jgi:fibronectin-binding autotransporter adhesin
MRTKWMAGKYFSFNTTAPMRPASHRLRWLLSASLSIVALGAVDRAYATDLVVSSALSNSPFAINSTTESVSGLVIVADDANTTGVITLNAGSLIDDTTGLTQSASLLIGSASGADGQFLADNSSNIYLNSDINSQILVGGRGGSGSLILQNTSTINLTAGISYQSSSSPSPLYSGRLHIGAEQDSEGDVQVLSGSKIYLEAINNTLTSASAAEDVAIQIGGRGSESTGGDGSLTISGVGSDVAVESTDAFVSVGNAGTGFLEVSDSGRLRIFGEPGFQQYATLNVAHRAGGQGVAEINNGTVLIGNDGSSSTIDSLQSRLRIGDAAGASGTLTMTGGNALVEMYGQGGVIVGKNSGTGTLTVEGGTLRAGQDNTALNPFIEVGSGAGSTGTVRLTGNSSLLQLNGDSFLAVGRDGGTGSLFVADGAQLQARMSETVTGVSNSVVDIRIGDDNGGKGTVLVSGTGDIDISNEQADGTARILLGSSSGTAASLTVTDNVSIASITGTTAVMKIGGDGTAGALSVTQGGSFGIGLNHEIVNTSLSTISESRLVVGANTFSSTSNTALSGSGTVLVDRGALIVGVLDRDEGATSALSDDSYLYFQSGLYVGTSTVILGEGAGDSGTMTVTGIDAQLILGGRNAAIAIGQSGTGTLTVSGGAVVSAQTTFMGDNSLHDQNMTVGENAGASGELIVTGVDSLLTLGDSLYLGAGSNGFGAGGAAKVTVADGGKIVAGTSIQIGGDYADTSVTRTLTLDGYVVSGSVLSGLLALVGSVASGQAVSTDPLNLDSSVVTSSNGATLSTPIVAVGTGGILQGGGTVDGDLVVRGGKVSVGGGAVLEVTGNSNALTTTTLFPGTVSMLTIAAGSSTDSGIMSISGSTTDFAVDGAANILIGGNGGTGALVVSDGAAVSAGSETFDMHIGSDGGKGALLVAGDGQFVAESFGASAAMVRSRLYVGDGGNSTGSIIVAGGGYLDVDNLSGSGDAGLDVGGSSLSASTGGAGTISLIGTDSTLDVFGPSAFLNIGNAGTGALVMSGGAKLEVISRIDSDPSSAARLSIGKGTGSGQAVIADSTVIVGDIDVWSQLNNFTPSGSPITTDTAVLEIGAGTGTGSMAVSGTSKVYVSGINSAVYVGRTGAGSLTISGGAEVLADLTPSGASSYVVSVGEQTGSTGLLTVTGSGSRLSTLGSVYIGAGSDGLGAGGAALVLVADGGVLQAGNSIQVGGDNANTGFTRTVSLNGGTLSAPNVIIGKGGLLNGSGTLTGNLLVRGGRVAAGFSPGTMTINGNLTLSAGGVLDVEIAGASTGQYDVYTVSGTADLSAGSISLTLLNGYTPQVQDSFTFLTATGGVTLPTGADQTTFKSTGQDVSYQLTQNEQTGGIDIVVTSVGGGTAEVQADIATETTQTEAATVTRTVVTAISNRVRAYQRSPTGQINQPDLQQLGFGTMTGVAGGDTFDGLNFWTDGTVTRLDSTNQTSPFNGYSETLLFGTDKLLADGKIVAGFAGGIDSSNLSLKGLGGERDSYGGSATFYAGYLLNETFSLDGQIGFGRYNNTITNRQAGGGSVGGDYHSNRVQSGFNLSANKQIDNWSLFGSGGFSWLQDRAYSYEASDGNTVAPGRTTLGQIRMTGEAAYQLTDTIQPYATATYEIDTVTTGSGDPSGMIVGLGVRAPLSEAISFGASATGQVLRHEEESYSLNVNLRFSF